MKYKIKVVPPRGMLWFAQATDPICPHEAATLFALLVHALPDCKIILLGQRGNELATALQIRG